MTRLFDLAVSLIAVTVLSPLLAVIALLVRLDSPGPALFRQKRVGRSGAEFEILKFRSMREQTRSAVNAPLVTADGDLRITRMGKKLRSTKLDELPQLINVVRGEMSLVGPRPEVPRYVELWARTHRDIILSVRPGITDPASIQFRYESELLAQQSDPEVYYETVVIPKKVAVYVEYVQSRSLVGDMKIVMRTVAALAHASGRSVDVQTPTSNTRAPDAASNGISFRSLRRADAANAAALHAAAFPEFFLSDLGVPFLRQLYIAFAEDPLCVSVVAVHGDELVGVAAGPTSSDGFLRFLVRRHLLRFSLAALPGIARNPGLIGGVVRRLGDSGGEGPAGYPALLSSICISRRCQGEGIGKQLLAEWSIRMKERGPSRVHLTTDADDNANTVAFYQKAGWAVASTVTSSQGRRMHVMTTELTER